MYLPPWCIQYQQEQFFWPNVQQWFATLIQNTIYLSRRMDFFFENHKCTFIWNLKVLTMLVWKILSKLASVSWAILKTVMILCNEIELFSQQKSYNRCKNQLSQLQLWTQIKDSLWKLWEMLRLAVKILTFLSLIW